MVAEGAGDQMELDKGKKVQQVIAEFEKQVQLEKRYREHNWFSRVAKIFAILSVVFFFVISLLLLCFNNTLNRISAGDPNARVVLDRLKGSLVGTGILLVATMVVFLGLLLFEKFKKISYK